MNTPKPPKHLRPATKRWWTQTVSEFVLEEHHLKLLALAADAWDRCQAAREAITEHGMTYIDRFGSPKARPEVAIERDSRVGFARTMREIGLDAGTPDAPRPPQLN